jgi:hypothetical protein
MTQKFPRSFDDVTNKKIQNPQKLTKLHVVSNNEIENRIRWVDGFLARESIFSRLLRCSTVWRDTRITNLADLHNQWKGIRALREHPEELATFWLPS